MDSLICSQLGLEMGVHSNGAVFLTESLRQPCLSFQRFRFTIARRRIRDKRLEQMMRGMRHFIDRAIERLFVRFRRLGESGKFSNKLQR